MPIIKKPYFKWLRLMGNTNQPSCSSSLGDQRTDDQQPNSSQAEDQRNSLLRLNNDCLRDVFDHLDKGTLCQLADVSTRVRSIAEKAFTKRYTKVILCYGTHYGCENFCEYKVVFRRTICKFGQLITSIEFNHDFCLEEQICVIIKCLPNLDDFRKKLQSDVEKIPNSFPKLIKLKLNASLLTVDTVRKLILLSPQLKRLQITGYVCDDHITTISKYAKGLEVLKITSSKVYVSERLTRAGLLQLMRLKNLKRFHYNKFTVAELKFAAPLITAFAKENVRLNYLHINGDFIESNGIKSIFNLKELEHLYLGDIYCVWDDLISLVSELPLLSTIGLSFRGRINPFSVNNLINMIKDGKQLQTINLYNVRQMKINQNVFEELLEVATNRLNQGPLTIKIIGYKSMVEVPHNIQYGNRDKLIISFVGKKGKFAF